MKNDITSFIKYFNVFMLLGILSVLTLAFIWQFYLNELPCPLCLLQRVGFLGITVGLLMNLRFGLRPSHYTIVLVSALFTSFVALRQIVLHIVPGTGSYGQAFLGLHLYTWSYVISMLVILATVILLGFEKQYEPRIAAGGRLSKGFKSLFFFTVFLAAANLVSVFLECGFKACPSDPVKYELLQSTE